MGSKNRYAKEILPIILKDRKEDQWYVEPFAGAFNVIDKVTGNRIANDDKYCLICLYIAIQNGWQPPDYISEEEYNTIKSNPLKYPQYYTGFVGYGCSYAGKWFGGYARGDDNKGNPRNYCLESKKNILSQYEGLQGIKIFNTDYRDLYIPENSVVYCDPPYAGTTDYGDRFNHEEFWKWCEGLVNQGHQVFVSEYTAPDNWECVWSRKVNNTLTKDTGSKQGVEKLFTMRKEINE
jgi:DNA adenine methylase